MNIYTPGGYINIIYTREVRGMKFQLTDQLKDYLNAKNHKSISLLTKIRSCWSGSYAEVSANFSGKPADVDVETYDVDGFTVYLQKGIESDKEVVTLGLQKFLFMEKISIDGIKLF